MIVMTILMPAVRVEISQSLYMLWPYWCMLFVLWRMIIMAILMPAVRVEISQSLYMLWPYWCLLYMLKSVSPYICHSWALSVISYAFGWMGSILDWKLEIDLRPEKQIFPSSSNPGQLCSLLSHLFFGTVDPFLRCTAAETWSWSFTPILMKNYNYNSHA
jgi:hypothetical protein